MSIVTKYLIFSYCLFRLIQKAEEISKKEGYKKLAVISAIGTRGYYGKLGYELKDLYQTKEIED